MIRRFAFLVACSFSSITASEAAQSMPRSLFSVNEEPKEGFQSETDLGISLVSGNTRSNTTHAKTQTSYRFPEETAQVFAQYNQANANGVTNANAWATGLRYERRVIPKLGAFAGQSLEGDRFAGFTQRYSTDAGLRKSLWGGERSHGATELGYRFQRENRRSGVRLNTNIIRVFGEANYKFHPKFTLYFSAEFLPSVRDRADWMTNLEASAVSTITDAFALKSAYQFRYDNRPAGPYRIDSALTTSVVAKF